MSLTAKYQTRTEQVDDTTGIRTIHQGTDWRGLANLVTTTALIGVLALTGLWFFVAWLLGRLNIAEGRELEVSALVIFGFGGFIGVIAVLLGAFKQASINANAGSQKAIETMAETMNRSMDIMQAQNQGFQSAMTALMQTKMQGQPMQPQLAPVAPRTMPELQKLTERQYKAMPEPVAEPVISVPMQDGTVREIPFKRIETIFKMVPEPTQDRWLAHGGGAVDQYGVTCETLCESDPPLLIRRPAPRRGYVAVGDSSYIAKWWDEIVNA